MVSNPFRPWQNETRVWTTSVFDALGRVISVATPENAVVTTAYSASTSGTLGTTVTVTDQAGKKRRSLTDALGRLIRVDEPDASGNLDVNGQPFQVTSYSYDVLDNLIMVNQGSQTRTFVYDSLRRLLSATNPESGTISYQYDSNGNLTQKTDARGVVSTYAYDALNRNTGVTYTNDPAGTPAVTRTYDGATNGKGKLWKTETTGSSGSRTTIDSVDALGRPLKQRQQFFSAGAWSQSYTVQRTYDRAGHVLKQTYPSGHTVNYAFDSAGRTSSLTGNLGEGVPRTYATDFQYTERGAIQQEKFGTETLLYHKQRFNQRGQLWDMRLSTVPFNSDPANGDRGAIVNYYSNNFVQGGTGTNNNGNLLRQEVYIPGSSFFQDNFTYDSLNRLTSISEKFNGTGNDTFKQANTFDRWGNRTIDQANTTANVPHPAYTVNTTKNRLNAPAGYAPLGYDNAGNLTQDSTSQKPTADSLYDAENRLAFVSISYPPMCYPDGEGGQNCYPTGSSTYQYVYDGEGRRVRRVVQGVTEWSETWQVYGLEGELLAEYMPTGSSVIAQPSKEYGYRNGQLLVTAQPWTNLALNKPATQIDDHAPSTTANKAVDGNADSGLWNGTASATNYHEHSWWQVDLQSVQNISSITVWGRTDCCPEMTSNFYVFVSDAPFTSYDLNTTLNQSGVSSYYNANWVDAASIPVNRTGRYVRVQLAGTQYLVLGEVQVWGGPAQVSWLLTDHLGTPRIIADRTGSTSGITRHDYLPFGEELYAGTGGRSVAQGYSNSDTTRQKFTRKERDNETGLDYFGARYFASTQGRFTSPDPFSFQKEMLVDPQRFNLYAYVRNNPLFFVDPTGMIIDTSGLSEDDQKKWQKILGVINAKDKDGNYINAKLHEAYERLNNDKDHTFFIENHSFGDRSSTVGETVITKHNGKDDFSQAVIRLDFEKVEHLDRTTDSDMVPGFKKFEGLIGGASEVLRAELFGHEGGGHGVWNLDHPAEAVQMQILLDSRDAALNAMPKGTKYPYPPDVLKKMEAADKALIPSERYAQQTEQVINKELRAYVKAKNK